MVSNPSPFFGSLPAELREQIWLSTFEPRTLSLSMREHQITLTPCSIHTFDTRLGLHVEDLTREEVNKYHSLLPQLRYRDIDLLHNTHRFKPPPGPIALEVCAESRMIALKHYELMFPGFIHTTESYKDLKCAFDASGWGVSHTWVNPQLDLIFLSSMSQDIGSHLDRQDLEVFWRNCDSERGMLERLGVMLQRSDLTPLLAIRKCTALKELVVYPTYREGLSFSFMDEEEIADWAEEFSPEAAERRLQNERHKWNEES